MSRKMTPEEYEKTFSAKFYHWFNNDRDLYLGQIEMKEQKEAIETPEEVARHNADWEAVKTKVYAEDNKLRRILRKGYNVFALLLCMALIGILIMTISYLPPEGSATNPANNEVGERYVEQGSAETGVVNTVTGMILQYRAFDTFGETNVLYIATCAVFILLLANQTHRGEETTIEEEEEKDRLYEPKADPILKLAAKSLVPVLFMFGIYILVNGHLSPGGGFSGGAILGSALILYNSAFGFTRTQRFFNEHIYEIVKVGSLCCYALIIGYYFFTGANGIPSIVPLGNLGDIISSGLILPINIFVGLEVACTMYAFYATFRKGGL